MNDTQNTQDGPVRKNKTKRRIITVIIVIAAVLTGGFLFLPGIISSDFGTDIVLNKVNKNIDGTVRVGDMSLSWFRGVKLDDLNYSDEMTSVDVRQVSARPKYASLLAGNIAVSDTVIDSPEVEITVDADKAFEKRPDETPAGNLTGDTGKTSGGVQLKNLGLEVKNGSIKINMLKQGSTQTLEFKNFESKVDLNPAGSRSSFDLSTQVVADASSSKLSASGSLDTRKDKKGWTLEGSDGQFAVDIEKLDIGSLKPLFALAGMPVEAQGTLDADADVKLTDGKFENVKADITLSNLRQKTPGGMVTIDKPVRINADVDKAGDEIKINRLDVDSHFANLECSGGLDEINFTADADLDKTSQFASQFNLLKGMELAGSLNAAGKVEMKKDIIAAEGTADVKNFKLTKEGKSTPLDTISAEFDIRQDKSKNTLELDTLKAVTSKLGTLTVKDSEVAMADWKEASSSLSVRADKIDLASVVPYASVFSPDLADLSLAGVLDGSMDLETRKGTITVKTEDTKITDLSVRKGTQEPFVQSRVDLSADVQLNPQEKTVRIDDFSLLGKEGRSIIRIKKNSYIEKDIKKNRTSVRGDIEAEYDLTALSAFASVYMPEDFDVSGKRSTKLKFTSEYETPGENEKKEGQTNPFLANLTGSADIGFEKLTFAGLTAGPLDKELTVKNGVLDIDLDKTPVNNGTLNFHGRLDMTSKPAMLSIPEPMKIADNINVNNDTAKNLLKYVHPLFSVTVTGPGTCNFQCDKLKLPVPPSKQNRSLAEMAGVLDIKGLRMRFTGLIKMLLRFSSLNQREIDVEMVPSRFELKNSLLTYNDMQMNLDKYPFNFNGLVNITGETVNMKAQTPYIVYMDGSTPDVKTLKKDQVADNTQPRLTVPMSGPLSNPNVDIQTALSNEISRIGRTAIEETIKGELSDIFGRRNNSTGESEGKDEAREKVREKAREILEGIFKQD